MISAKQLPGTEPTLLLTSSQAARSLAISERTLWSLTSPKGPIPVVRFGRSVRYDPVDLQKWVEEQKNQ